MAVLLVEKYKKYIKCFLKSGNELVRTVGQEVILLLLTSAKMQVALKWVDDNPRLGAICSFLLVSIQSKEHNQTCIINNGFSYTTVGLMFVGEGDGNT